MEEKSRVGCLEKPVAKSVVLRPVTLTEWGEVLPRRKRQVPGVGSLTLTISTFLMLSSSFTPDASVRRTPARHTQVKTHRG